MKRICSSPLTFVVVPRSRPLVALYQLQPQRLGARSFAHSFPCCEDEESTSEKHTIVFDRYDWRGRALSRILPGGLIDPPLPADGVMKFKLKRRAENESSEREIGNWRTAVENYKLRFLDLLEAERESEEAIINSRLKHWSLAKLEKEGYCLTGLSAFWLHTNQFKDHVATFLLGPGVALPFHRFDNGTQVLLSRLDPLKNLTSTGSVVSTTDAEIHVSFDAKENLDGDATWRLDIFNTDIAYTRMRAAVNHLQNDPQLQRVSFHPDFDPILQGTFLRDVLLRTFNVPEGDAEDIKPKKRNPDSSPGIFCRDQRIQSWSRRYSVQGTPIEVEGDPKLEDLNHTQRRAVALMLGERVSLVQGPPGTGKTKTITEAIRLLKAHFQVPQPILVCTYTNVAVDNLVEGLVAKGLRPLRVGYAAKVRPSVHSYTLEKQVDIHPGKKILDTLQKRIDQLRLFIVNVERKLNEAEKYSATHTRYVRLRTDMQEQVTRLVKWRWSEYQKIVADIVNKADVICTTCITAASWSLRSSDFPIVFLDEASMSTEPASLIPLMKGSAHLALIGDHKQLPPVITSKKAQAGGLDVSLFERLIEEKVTPSVMLDMQYRMHPALSRFPSSEFYNHSVTDATVSALGEISSLLLPPTSAHLEVDPETGCRPSVIFLDHTGDEALRDRSRVNHNEARIVCAVIEDLFLNNPHMTGYDIGVIAPYTAQISLLKRQFMTNKTYRKYLEGSLGPVRAMEMENIEVKTVDGFEGREKDVIIFSTVRNNAGGHIGFLADRRRMNVGLTRARRGLFVIGSAGTLRTVKIGSSSTGIVGTTTTTSRKTQAEREVWVRYMEWLTQNGAVKTLQGETLQKMLSSVPQLRTTIT